MTIADLIGDIDPIKAATRKLAYADEEVIHFGIIPRTNRGIFAINELPDLPPRIQVGLLNIMEEKDIQIRGFPIRMQLDILMVYSANPEDYTNRGNIITPLKDRIDSQIITHYPQDRQAAMRDHRAGGVDGARTAASSWSCPDWFRELVEEVAFAARRSEYVNQASGVSARMSISLLENVMSNMERRAIIQGEKQVYPRIGDLHAAVTAITGKVELVYEGEQQGAAIVARKIIGEAVKETFRRWFPDPTPKKKKEGQGAGEEQPPARQEPSPFQPILAWFSKGNTVETSDEMPHDDYVKRLEKVHGPEGDRGQAPGPEGRGRDRAGHGVRPGGPAPALHGLQAGGGREDGLPRHAEGHVRPHGGERRQLGRRPRMRWEYSEWDQTLQDLLKSFQDLMSLFNYLLLMAGGDVDKVFKWMEYLQERGSLDPDVDLEEFRRQLEEQRIIEQLKEGGYSLTAKGEQVIRKDSLNQIFNGLQKSGFGQHRVPSTGNGEERLTETRPWRFGDPVTQIDALGTISNAVKRAAWTRSPWRRRTSRSTRPSTCPPAPRCSSSTSATA